MSSDPGLSAMTRSITRGRVAELGKWLLVLSLMQVVAELAVAGFLLAQDFPGRKIVFWVLGFMALVTVANGVLGRLMYGPLSFYAEGVSKGRVLVRRAIQDQVTQDPKDISVILMLQLKPEYGPKVWLRVSLEEFKNSPPRSTFERRKPVQRR
jgi:hypothetical protein